MKGGPTGSANSSVYVQVAPIRISSIYSVAEGIILTRSACDRRETRRVWRVVLEFGGISTWTYYNLCLALQASS